MKDDIKRFIRDHALEETPNECCGIVYQDKETNTLNAIKCKNVAENKRMTFSIDPIGYLEADQLGEIIAFYHSHVNEDEFSDFDIINSEHHEIKFIMYCLKTATFHEYEPKSYESPYIGKDFNLGKQDCFTLGQQYYKKEFDIDIKDYYRGEEWFVTNPDSYDRYYEEAGFKKILDGPIEDVSEIKKHDAILIKCLGMKNPTHGAIYVGNDMILHHQVNCFSRMEYFNKEMKSRTVAVLRHESLM